MIKIVTLTGASGVGKTTIAKKLLQSSEVALIRSLTSREKRDSDIPGEYVYGVANEDFAHAVNKDAFLWKISAYGNTYGTLRSSVEIALEEEKISLMLLVPKSVEILLEKYGEQIFPVYIISPPANILEKRLRKRGDTEEVIAKRLLGGKTYNEDAIKSEIPYMYVPNNQSIQRPVNAIRNIINKALWEMDFKRGIGNDAH